MLPSDSYRLNLSEQAKVFIDQRKWVETLDALSMLMLLDGINMNVAMSNLKSLKMQQEPTTVSSPEPQVSSPEPKVSIQETLPFFDTKKENAACIENTQVDNSQLSNIRNHEIDDFFKQELSLEPQHSSLIWDLFLKRFESKMSKYDLFVKEVEPGATPRPRIYQRFRDRYTELKNRNILASNPRNQYSLHKEYYEKMNKSDNKQIQVNLS